MAEGEKGEGAEVVEDKVEKKVLPNKWDMGSVKHTLDEVIADVVTRDCEYPEDFTASNVRNVLSLLACLMAPASHFVPPYMEKNEVYFLSSEMKTSKNLFVLACVVVFGVNFLALLAFQFMYEREAILFTRQKEGSYSTSGLRVSTVMNRFDDVYKITLEERKAGGNTGSKEKLFGKDPMTFEKSVTKWIDEDGVIVQDVVASDVAKFVRAFEKSAYKSKKSK
ncbi:putative subunit 2 of microsomal signal peptidase complex [Chloropicon primus]|uniref:Signal peptidase complex subunit 2 n=1 Tax=Chloropicon primus TaxID=1764295 RepID=A0A5B8MDD3_9CHLO|nr:putative subunit 2 of microsomal signal peptidase complex [Chloropicon primus]UPQ97629.1 putative subunit 2 of microsomal signal peptidase complex [Chloropicon primus]|mmetsp:Transcript_2993/g.8123  ORF Transcript_2993/g.8123 Transcript_2993/m.8123 type:complete len:223 (+) Transcript_2993:338-1006(+)|eukprot:QDZ18419.1 putative subunit 2 of microsomal signal peptidase complex [Chloropicon primus]